MSSWARRLAFADLERDRWVAEQAARLPAGVRVLDVGAGPCRHRPLFAHGEYRAQDFCAHQAATEGGPFATGSDWRYGEIDYECDATSIPVPDASFDAVLCTEVLEHVPDPVAVVREIARVLKDGGTLLLTAPLASGLHQEPHHYYGGFTPFWYERFLSELGFEGVRVEANGGFFRHYGQESTRFSALIDPRRTRGGWRLATAPLWLLTLPLLRVVVPLACHWLDRMDTHRGFTVGYHVRATRRRQPRP